MYLYYLLGYQLVDRQMKEEQIKEVTNGKSIFDILPSSIVEQVYIKSSLTHASDKNKIHRHYFPSM